MPTRALRRAFARFEVFVRSVVRRLFSFLNISRSSVSV